MLTATTQRLTSIEQRLLRKLLRLLFELRSRKRHAHTCLEAWDGFSLLITPQVFNPALFGSSFFLQKYLRQYPVTTASRVLDLGCGSGLLGLTLARRGAQVVATDINPEAVWVAATNARLNHCQSNHEARQGSLYEPVSGEKFDLIVMNPPYYAHTPQNALEQAFMAGPELEVLQGMLVGAAQHLKPEGRALAVVSSTIPLAPILEAVQQAGMQWQVVAKKRYWAEWHLIYELKLAHG